MQDTRPLLLKTTFPPVFRRDLSILQVNLGYLCNLSCTHCHVNAGPSRTEQMSSDLVELVIEVLQQKNISTLDLTGGAPEMNPHFSYLVEQARSLGVKVIDRCNLTVLLEKNYAHLAEFMARFEVEIVASLPCYAEKNVTEQRGKHVFQDSIKVLKRLNALGYGISENLVLNLVYNPNGAFLPPNQQALEEEYKLRLAQDHGVRFHRLLTITNMPIQRFGAVLLAQGKFEEYMTLLRDSYSPANLENLMCRDTVSVDWQGYLYDCDFNQMLEMPLAAKGDLIARNGRPHLRELLNEDLSGEPVAVAEHCFGCSAGQGSSCGGALEK